VGELHHLKMRLSTSFTGIPIISKLQKENSLAKDFLAITFDFPTAEQKLETKIVRTM